MCNQSDAGGEDFERFDHELATTSWSPHRPQLPGESGRRPSYQIEPKALQCQSLKQMMKCSAPNIHTGAGKALARVGISKDRLWSRSDRGASAGLETNLETQICLHKYSSHGFHDPLCNRNYRECPQAIVSWDSLSTLPTPTLRPLQKEFAAPGFIFAGFSLLWQNHLTSCTYFREPGVEFALAVQVVVHFSQL